MTRDKQTRAFRLRFMALNLHFLSISTSETKENLNPPWSRQRPKEKRSKSEQNIIFISHFHLASHLTLSLSPSIALLLLAALHILLYQPADLTVLGKQRGREAGRRERDCFYLYARVRQGEMRVIGCHWTAWLGQQTSVCVCGRTNDLGNELGQAQFNVL